MDVGQEAEVSFNALPGMTFVCLTVTAETRTAKVRIELPNHEGHLRPSLYGTVQAAPVAKGPVVAVPDSAVLDTSAHQAVLVERGEGLFEPREIKAGTRADGYVEVMGGLKEGETVIEVTPSTDHMRLEVTYDVRGPVMDALEKVALTLGLMLSRALIARLGRKRAQAKLEHHCCSSALR